MDRLVGFIAALRTAVLLSKRVVGVWVDRFVAVMYCCGVSTGSWVIYFIFFLPL